MERFLQGQVVLITGGSRGIGRSIALRLAQEAPAHLVIAYCMNHEAARKTVADIRSLGVSASAMICDVGNDKLQREMFGQIQQKWGRLDVLVANAARTAFSPTLDLDLKSWRRTMELNLESFLVGGQLAANIMKAQNRGRIIGISSLGSRYYIPNYAALGAAKSSIETLARYLAVELAPHNINVNIVCGGFINTESMRMLPEYKKIAEGVIARTPAGRLGTGEDLAGIVAFLCSPESDWIRGQTIIADGGYTLSL